MIEGKLMPASVRELPDFKVEIIFRETGTVMGMAYTGMSIAFPCRSDREFMCFEGTSLVDTEDKDTLSWVGIGSIRPTEKRYTTKLLGIKQCRTGIQRLAGLNKERLAFEAEIESNGSGWYKDWKIK